MVLYQENQTREYGPNILNKTCIRYCGSEKKKSENLIHLKKNKFSTRLLTLNFPPSPLVLASACLQSCFSVVFDEQRVLQFFIFALKLLLFFSMEGFLTPNAPCVQAYHNICCKIESKFSDDFRVTIVISTYT